MTAPARHPSTAPGATGGPDRALVLDLLVQHYWSGIDAGRSGLNKHSAHEIGEVRFNAALFTLYREGLASRRIHSFTITPAGLAAHSALLRAQAVDTGEGR